MTPKTKDPNLVLPPAESWIPRLNVLLRFAQIDVLKLTNGEWGDLLDDLYFSLYNLKRDRTKPEGDFHEAATPEGVSKAQRELKRQLESQDDMHLIPLAEQTMILFNMPNRGEFVYRFTSKDFTTMVFMEFAHLLFMSALKPADFLRCPCCETWFVPKRKPRKGMASYCSKRCANVIASRNFRAKKKKVKVKKKKPK
jgi:hypothetical protein